MFEVSSGVTLVGRVEEGVEAFGFYEIRDLVPLLEGGIYSRGVVGACVEQHNRFRLGSRKTFYHAVEIKSSSLRVEVRVFDDVKAGIFNNS